jgi:non-homologous end joining protein Ku|tara:strand:+ start:376 stop:558 length:183 start_codon:yes stop_codon:yes gene_type:complete
MRDWKVKLVQIHKRHAELEVSAHSEQEAIEIAESIVEEEPEAHWSNSELEDQYVEEMAEL